MQSFCRRRQHESQPDPMVGWALMIVLGILPDAGFVREADGEWTLIIGISQWREIHG